MWTDHEGERERERSHRYDIMVYKFVTANIELEEEALPHNDCMHMAGKLIN